MADESQTSPFGNRAFDWRAIFPFTHIFRAFRVAVHPSKLVLGLLALLTLYAGGRILDAVWPTNHLAMPGEIERYSKSKDRERFSDAEKAKLEQSQRGYQEELRRRGLLAQTNEADKTFDRLSDIKSHINWVANEDRRKADEAFAADKKIFDNEGDPAKKRQAESEAKERLYEAKEKANATRDEYLEAIDEVKPRGIFRSFFEYEIQQVNGVSSAVLNNNWLIVGGVKDSVFNFLGVGPAWLWTQHPLYAALFTILFLLTWAVFGGAISRIAAVHVSRDEKISVRQALRFSLNKLLSFVFAPVIPLVIILVIGVVIAVGGLLMYVPVVGPIVVGAAMILALIAGVVITLVLFGTVGGFGLMYPTIAVEGSDSFDAISRSFSYVFARPWRMLFYTVVAILYGALTYLFVRFFVWVVLCVTHLFAQWFLAGQPGMYFDTIWPAPVDFFSFKLPYDINYAGLAWSEDIAATLIALWVYLTIGLVGAYAISYYLSVSTIIYGLMRREVDATELEDVYVEDTEDDLMDVPPTDPMPATATAPAATAAATATTTESLPAVTEVPPATPPPGDMPPGDSQPGISSPS